MDENEGMLLPLLLHAGKVARLQQALASSHLPLVVANSPGSHAAASAAGQPGNHIGSTARSQAVRVFVAWPTLARHAADKASPHLN